MLWNVLAISSRVAALALFASHQLHWFWALLGAQISITTSASLVYERFSESKEDFIIDMFYSFYVGVGMIFNVIWVFDLNLYFYVYLLYWLLMFTENTVMISLWYVWSVDLRFWYHNAAIVGVIAFYVLSLAFKTAHCYFYKLNSKKKNILKWLFYTEKEPLEEQTTTSSSLHCEGGSTKSTSQKV